MTLRDRRLSPWLNRILPSSELLCGVSWFKTDVSGLPNGFFRRYQNDWSGFKVDYIHKCGEQNYKC